MTISPSACGGQHLLVDARARLVAACVCAMRRQLEQIMVADLILGQQQQVVVFVAAGLLFERGDRVALNAYNWLDARRFARLVELDGAIHAAVVGEGQRIHAARFGRLDQPLDTRLAVEQAIFGMDVQVGKVGHGLSPSLAVSRLCEVRASRGRRRASRGVCQRQMQRVRTQVVQMYRRSGTPQGNLPLAIPHHQR